ncbi:hypothetical protein Sjap_015089 [Stephania japonica]|uniref:Retrovirus-related Pol polyprotein from transposon TNT 1-94-like beta-barrel domain-containing protein n=1 Tax=Stephania japonica TaxID=461633 RepID=A0AAP0IIR6_9MAGN
MAQLIQLESTDRLMQFLMRLHDVFNHVRNQILVLDPLPSINKAYSMILRVEKQKEVNVAFAPHLESVMLVQNSGVGFKGISKGSFKKFTNKEDLFCDYCKKKKRHTKESCFKHHGTPEWFKKFGERNGDKVGDKPAEKSVEKKSGIDSSRAFVNLLESPMDFNDEAPQKYEDFQLNMANMIQQGIEKFMKGKQLAGASSSSSSYVNLAHIPDFEGNFCSRAYCSSVIIGNDSWIVDTGASNHMCTDFSLLVKPMTLSRPTPVYLPDGTTKHVDYVGDVILAPKLILQSSLHLSFFKYNLLSVSKFTKFAKIKFVFTFCVLQM